MTLTLEQRLHQSRTKWRIIACREMRELMRGERTVIGNYDRRRERDLVEQAFRAGVRAAKNGEVK